MKNFQKTIFILLFTFSCAYSQNPSAIFNSASSGSLDGVPFTFSITGGTAFNVTTSAYNSSNFSPTLFAVHSLFVQNSAGWTINFSSPISNLRLYCGDIRSTLATMSHVGTKRSGSSNFKTFSNGNGLQVSGSSAESGIIEFSGDILSLTIGSNVLSSSSSSIHLITFTGTNANATTLSHSLISKKDLSLFTTDHSSFIRINNVDKQTGYKIYNSLGKLVLFGKTEDNQNINISSLVPAIYFIKTVNGKHLKFVKK